MHLVLDFVSHDQDSGRTGARRFLFEPMWRTGEGYKDVILS
ncbi:hypothetical protein TIFTF001_055523 [Ficus carica]|uniref:Uncharacterized protein n=1 Tax=Ficus carica TaxID=3494 RepID=A0AA88JGG2_FICCA|nr:hypothetical protein TIFTF001_055522 [Ficus carica]GMN71343.1 hypothetical protein TIFTF001_055523 [Ficus carica]